MIICCYLSYYFEISEILYLKFLLLAWNIIIYKVGWSDGNQVIITAMDE